MKVMCEISMRHIHLSKEDMEALFGKDAELTIKHYLSQPGEYQSEQRLTIIGPKRSLENVAVLGPVRVETQVELARTDCYFLGLKNVPLRESGHLEGTPGVTLKNGDITLEITKGVIMAKRHVHMDTATAEKLNLINGQIVSVAIGGERGGVLGNTVVRVSKNYFPAVHLDSDEGNALDSGAVAEIVT